MNKERILKYMQIAYANVEQAVAELNSGQLSEPGAEGDWSVKDIIAHLGYWMQREADELKTARGETIENFYDSRLSVDAANKLVYAQNRDREVEEIMENYRKGYRDLAGEVRLLSDDDLSEALIESIASDSYAHINEHLAALRNYIKTVQGQPWPRA